MSLYVASSASRRIRHNLLSTTLQIMKTNIHGTATAASSSSARNFTSKSKGSGLRRIQNKGRHNSTKPTSSAAPQTKTAAQTAEEKFKATDPHSIANEMIFNSTTMEGRISGTEAISSLTREQKMSNYAMAGGLLGFVSFIFYYSLASVGGADNAKQIFFGKKDADAAVQGEGGEGDANPGFEEFLKEANEGRSLEEKRMEEEIQARGEARELADMERTTSARLKAEGVEDVIVAASANEEEEREMARAAGFEEGDKGGEGKSSTRPLWKRVVFFWRRE